MLANLYRDCHDSVDWHADDEPALGPQPTIASLSFGDTRNFELRKNPPESVLTFWRRAIHYNVVKDLYLLKYHHSYGTKEPFLKNFKPFNFEAFISELLKN